jgi:glutathione S-transferase
MLLYDAPMPAPNPRRVRMFLAEKGVSIPMRSLSIEQGENKAADFLKLSPYGQLPALALDDGQVLTESVAICRYLELLHPQTPLLGTTPMQSATIEMWVRRVDLRLGRAVSLVWLHTNPFTARFVKPQYPEFGQSQVLLAQSLMAELDAALAQQPWLAGDALSIADIVLLCTLDFGSFVGIAMPERLSALQAWYARMKARPSFDA